MANTFDDIVDTIFAMGLVALRENAIMPRLINTDWGAETAQQGDTINVPIPSAMQVDDVQPGPTPPAGQDVAPTTVPIALNKWRKTDMHVTDKQAREIVQSGTSLQVSEAMRALGNDVDRFVLGLYAGVYGLAGTPGTTPFASTPSPLSDATNARKVLGDQLAPSNPRRIVLGTDAEANALLIRAVQDASFRANTDNTLRTGLIGVLLGFEWYMDQNILSHVAGTGTGYLVAQADHAVGDTTVDVDTGTGTILPGDLFTVAGDDQTYAVESFAAGTITYGPPAATAFADNAAIALEADHVVNLAFHRDAFALAVRPLAPADGFTGGNQIRTGVDPVSGLALTLEVSREHNRTKYQWSVLYGASLVRPALAARIAG